MVHWDRAWGGSTNCRGSRGAVADPGVAEGAMAPQMAAKGGHIDFMFLAPLTRSLDPLLGG